MVELVERKPLLCKNCGGNIDRVTMKCPYCDTQYEREHGEESSYLPVDRRGVERICVSMAVDNEHLLRSPNITEHIFMNKVMGMLAKELLKYATITVQDDHCSFRKIINATIAVVPPKGE